jgi:hypothetical protein
MIAAVIAAIIINEVRMGRTYRTTVTVDGSKVVATYEYTVDPTWVVAEDYGTEEAARAHMEVIRAWCAEQESDNFKFTIQ